MFLETVVGGEAERARFVFLHGLGATHRYWTAAGGLSFLPANSILIDLYGFGRSPRPLIRYTLDAHLAALETVLAREQQLLLVGHSLGAALALAYAARHPDQVEALVLIGLPAYGSQEEARRWLRPRPRGWILTNMVLTAVACVTTRRLLGPLLPYLIRGIPAEVARDIVAHNFLSSTTSLWEILYRHDLATDLRSLDARIPVIFIHGTEDTTAPIDRVRTMAGERQRTRLVELEQVDHHPWLRQPDLCATALAGTTSPDSPAPATVGSSTPTSDGEDDVLPSLADQRGAPMCEVIRHTGETWPSNQE